MRLLISMQMELPMNRIKILNKTGKIQDSENNEILHRSPDFYKSWRFALDQSNTAKEIEEEIDTIDDLKVIASAGSDAVKGTNPSQWVVVFIAVMAVIIVVPIQPIALAYIAGHYCNWWASNNLNERK